MTDLSLHLRRPVPLLAGPLDRRARGTLDRYHLRPLAAARLTTRPKAPLPISAPKE